MPSHNEYDSSRRAVDPELILAAEYELAQQYDVDEQRAMLQDFAATPRANVRHELPTEFSQPYMETERGRYELPTTSMPFASGPSQTRADNNMWSPSSRRQLQEPVGRDTHRRQSENRGACGIDRGFGERYIQRAAPTAQPEFRRPSSTTTPLLSATDRQMQTREPRSIQTEMVPRRPPQSAAQVASESMRPALRGEERTGMARPEWANGGQPAYQPMASTQTQGAARTGPARNRPSVSQNNNNCTVSNHLHMNDNRQYHITTDNHTRQTRNVQYTSQRGPTYHKSHNNTERHRSTNQSYRIEEPRLHTTGRAPSENIALRGRRTREQMETTPLRNFFGCGPRATRVPDDRPC